MTVYPRVCGGTLSNTRSRIAESGLSPRVRGNRLARLLDAVGEGSIPACAGEPRVGIISFRPPWVYPRVCGGTVYDLAEELGLTGLSPRVRGNLDFCPLIAESPRSIPACAGEPNKRGRIRIKQTVYPRVCGGTNEGKMDWGKLTGLSPRVRGNPGSIELAQRMARSIPACAGEPTNGAGETSPLTVYPRVCGGTNDNPDTENIEDGLSPRVRGNLACRRACGLLPSRLPLAKKRSIPACAGEPLRNRSPRYAVGVYPRVCGGTIVVSGFKRYPLANRSIPACAGEPR